MSTGFEYRYNLIQYLITNYMDLRIIYWTCCHVCRPLHIGYLDNVRCCSLSAPHMRLRTIHNCSNGDNLTSILLQVSVVDELGIPVKFVGVGEGVDDLQPFDAEAFVNAIFPWELFKPLQWLILYSLCRIFVRLLDNVMQNFGSFNLKFINILLPGWKGLHAASLFISCNL